jgi:hypothetical protein
MRTITIIIYSPNGIKQHGRSFGVSLIRAITLS